MSALRYRCSAYIEDLDLGECTMHRAVMPDGSRFWHLWFRVNRDSDGQPDTFCVPMNPRGDFIENGRGGRTWGLRPTGPGLPYGAWQVSPSINVIHTREVHPGAHEEQSLWHQTPMLVDVPPTEPWITEAP